MHPHQKSGHIGDPRTLQSVPVASRRTASAFLRRRHAFGARAIVLSFKHEAEAAA